MRPERLALSAFGPFAGEQRFDFAELGAHRLFLIHGPTGAGKTTLLDALCYALFGSSSGDERLPAHLRSQYAEAATATWVELDFALGRERYRIRRSPEQEGLGRGGRAVRVAAKVTLWRCSDDGRTVLADQERRVCDEVERLLGYSETEFRQVVVLPQGRFRDVLMARPGDRQAILATLFRTSLYARIQRQLDERAKAARQQALGAEERRAALLGQSGAATPEAAAERVRSLEAEAGAARVRATQLRAAADGAGSRLVLGRQAAALIEAATLAAVARAALRSREPEMAAEFARLAAARRAEFTLAAEHVLAQVESQTHRARADADAAAAAMDAALRRLAAARSALEDEPARAGRIEALRSQAASFDTQAGVAKAAEEAELRAAQALRRTRLAQDDHAHAVAGLARAREAQQRAAALAAEAAGLAEQLSLRQAALAQASAVARDAETLTALAAQMDTLSRRRDHAADASQQALAGLREATSRRQCDEAALRAYHAAFLAQRLVAGAACPVCGSHEHPAPHAERDGALPDLDASVAAEDALRLRHASSQDVARRADHELARTIEMRDLVLTRLAAELDASTAAQRVQRAQASVDEADRAADGRAALMVAAEQAAERVAQAQQAVERADAAARARHAETDALQGAIAALRARAPADGGDSRALARHAAMAAEAATAAAARLAADQTELAGADAAGRAARDLATAQADRAGRAARALEDARAEWDAAWRAAGFSDAEAARAARLAPAQVLALDAALTAFDRERLRAEMAAEQTGAAAATQVAPDLPALVAEDAAARAAADQATAEAGRLQEQHRRAADLMADLRLADDDLLRDRARHAMLAEIADGAAGKNDRRLSLEGFVLASILDEALAAANEHLGRMLGGRYRVQRRQEPLRANAAVGLEIEVCDDWTGQVRPAGTLSGGEGFCAALALALGLADTVQAHAGARRIDTLFIDEGFGSLDEDALDTAMDVLSRLQAGDRLVGIISHVAELRSRIPAHLVVRPGPRGSTAAFAC